MNYEVDPITGEFRTFPPESYSKSKFEDRWAVRTVNDAFKAKNDTIPWVVENLLLSNTATLVSAQPHAMKSLSWLAACMEAVHRGTIWGHFKCVGVDSTLFIETEDSRQLVEARIRGLARGLGLKEGDELHGFNYARVGPFPLLDNQDRLRKLYATHKPKFVVLSTLQNLLNGVDWNRQEQMQPVLGTIIELSEICPTVLITHSPWDKRQKRAAGTVTQAANFATALHYQKDKDSVKVSVDCKAGGETTEFWLNLQTEGPRNSPESVRGLTYSNHPSKTKSQAILDYVKQHPDAKNTDIAESVGCQVRHVQKVLKDRTIEARKG